MLDWKRVDLLLKAVALVCHQPNFGKVDIVGTGPEKSRLLELAQKLGLGAKCVFHEPVAADRVRELMRQADVYVLPSNRNEGWGVVANEAMSEGAVLVSNEQAGAAPVLIDHGRTGFLFEDGNIAALATILRMLLSDASLRETVRQAAWQEMQQLWHPRVGAERLVGLCQGLLGRAPMPEYSEGPCSRATVK
jgi:glycosyltransferase involved in cell wall biosynthesis